VHTACKNLLQKSQTNITYNTQCRGNIEIAVTVTGTTWNNSKPVKPRLVVTLRFYSIQITQLNLFV